MPSRLLGRNRCGCKSRPGPELTFISVEISDVFFGVYPSRRLDPRKLVQPLVVVRSKYRSAAVWAVAHPARPVRMPAQHWQGEAKAPKEHLVSGTSLDRMSWILQTLLCSATLPSRCWDHTVADGQVLDKLPACICFGRDDVLG